MDLIKIGKITAPVGVKGEVRVYPYTDKQTRFSAVKELFVGNERAVIESVRYQKDMAVIKLDISPDRNAAESLRGKELFLDRKDLWEIPEGTYFVRDILGSEVRDEDGKHLGTLSDVIQNPAQDIYVIKDENGRESMVPAVKEFIKDVDTDNKIIVIHVIEGLLG